MICLRKIKKAKSKVCPTADKIVNSRDAMVDDQNYFEIFNKSSTAKTIITVSRAQKCVGENMIPGEIN